MKIGAEYVSIFNMNGSREIILRSGILCSRTFSGIECGEIVGSRDTVRETQSRFVGNVGRQSDQYNPRVVRVASGRIHRY